MAWVDLAKEQVILSHPDMGERFFTFELGDMSSDNFGGRRPAHDWEQGRELRDCRARLKGTLPSDVRAIQPSTTPMLLIIGRTLVDGKADVPAAQKLMHQYKLTPLSMWGKPDANVPRRSKRL